MGNIVLGADLLISAYFSAMIIYRCTHLTIQFYIWYYLSLSSQYLISSVDIIYIYIPLEHYHNVLECYLHMKYRLSYISFIIQFLCIFMLLLNFALVVS